MAKKIIEKDTRLFLRISTELKTKIEAQAKIKNISIDVLIQSNRDNVRSIYGF